MMIMKLKRNKQRSLMRRRISCATTWVILSLFRKLLYDCDIFDLKSSVVTLHLVVHICLEACTANRWKPWVRITTIVSKLTGSSWSSKELDIPKGKYLKHLIQIFKLLELWLNIFTGSNYIVVVCIFPLYFNCILYLTNYDKY